MSYIKKIIPILLTVFLCTSCASTIKREPLPELKLDKTSEYSIDLTKIEKPSPIRPIFAHRDDSGNIKESSMDDANVVILEQEEYKKVAQLVILATSYKKIIEQQTVLVNNQIDINNSLKEFVELERLKSREYQNMWLDSENTYLSEKYDHKVDNVLNKIVQLILTGAIVAIAL